jgi:hypothetical protein
MGARKEISNRRAPGFRTDDRTHTPQPPRDKKELAAFSAPRAVREALSEKPRKRKRFVETLDKVAIIIIEIVNIGPAHGVFLPPSRLKWILSPSILHVNGHFLLTPAREACVL